MQQGEREVRRDVEPNRRTTLWSLEAEWPSLARTSAKYLRVFSDYEKGKALRKNSSGHKLKM